MQLLLAIENMQTQIRAENGIQEKVIGYFGEPDFDEEVPLTPVSDILQEFDGPVQTVSPSELPEEVRQVYLAEMHRLDTGEVKKSTDFKVLQAEVDQQT